MRRRTRLWITCGAVVVAAAGAAAVGFAESGTASNDDPDYSAVVESRTANAQSLGGTSSADDVVSMADLDDAASLRDAIAQAEWRDPDGTGNLALAGAQPAGAVEFPEGVTYPKAVTLLFMAAVADKAPAGARLVASLPVGKVAVVPPDGSGKVIIDLRIPFAFSPTGDGGKILLPSVSSDPGEAPEATNARGFRMFGRAGWPIGARVVPMILPRCMRLFALDDSDSPACRPSDIALQDLNLLKGPRLP
jgi:hypothetical protein